MRVGRGVGKAKRGALALLGAMATLFFVVSVTQAAPVTKGEALFRIDKTPQSVVGDPVTGHIFFSDTTGRIDEYTPWGEFIRAFGTDVAPGAVNEQQEIRVRAGAGSFKLTFGASTTADLSFDATAAKVQSALNALASIGGAGGSVAVADRPGKAASATPYIFVVTFKGSLAGTNVAQLTAADGSTPLSAGNPKTELEVHTRADGTPGTTGLESCTEESGCQEGAQGEAGGRLNSDRPVLGPTGNIYVAEGTFGGSGGGRVQEFDPGGHFLRAWGGDVIRDGAAGSGVVSPGSTLVTAVETSEKVFRIDQPIEGAGIEPDTKIAAIGAGTITLSQPAGPAATGEATAIAAPPGVNDVPSNETQTISLGSNTTGGTFGLTFVTPKPSSGRVGAGNTLVYRNASNGNFEIEKGDSFTTANTTSGSPTVTSVATAFPAELVVGSTKVIVFGQSGNKVALSGPAPGTGISGTGITPGTTLVLGVNEGELELSSPATASGTGVSLSLTTKGKADTSTGSKEITLTNATANATLTAGSKVVTGINRSSGFTGEEEISGPGIPAATGTGTITAGSLVITSVSGSFKVGEKLFAPGIPSGTKIEAVEPGKLRLSGFAEASASGVSLKAVTTYTFRSEGEIELSSPAEASGIVAVKAGGAKVGGAISGPGIPVGTTVLATAGRTVTLSAAATATASEASVSLVRRPFVGPGEVVSGPGIPAGATVESVAPNGDLTLSANATASAAGAPLNFGIAYNASAPTLQSVLAAMPSIGTGNVAVSGPSGGPWTVEFKGPRLANTNVEALEANGAALTVSSGHGEGTVSSTNAAEICETAAECQRGAQGDGPGQLSSGSPSHIAFSPDGNTLYEASGDRIQKFSPNGAYLGTLADPSEALKGRKGIQELAANPISGDLYVSFSFFGGRSDIFELNPTGGSLVHTLAMERPGSLATSAAGELYAISGGLQFRLAHVVAFDAAGNQVAPSKADEEQCKKGEGADPLGYCEEVLGIQIGRGDNVDLGGLGTVPSGDLYVGFNQKEERYIQAYGPPPLQLESPPLVGPTVEDQYAISVDTTGAELGAKINPHFFSGPLGETRYYVQYGTAACIEPTPGEVEWDAPCAQVSTSPPGSKLRSGAVAQGVGVTAFLSGLEPRSEYRYRFVAESTGAPGQQVYGIDPDGKGPEQASPEAGLGGSFATAPTGISGQECPENEVFRSGAAAPLPDCRAYELVSPVDKNGGNILALRGQTTPQPVALDESTPSGDKFSYSTYKPFGDAESAPWSSMYVAARDSDGWTSHGVTPPRTIPKKGVIVQALPEFLAFSPDLCQAWVRPLAEPPLAPGATPGSFNLYRRTDEECGGPSYETVTTVEPPAAEVGKFFISELDGVSTDESKVFFAATAALTANAPTPEPENQLLYERSEGKLSFVCILPDLKPVAKSCSAGDDNSAFSQGLKAEVHNAVSDDGERVFWSPKGGGITSAPLYLREHPDRPQSSLAHGSATGTGNVENGSNVIGGLVAAKGKGNLTSGSNTVTIKEVSVGEFAAGQPITGSGVPPGATVLSCSPQCGAGAETLTLSANATATKEATLTSKGPQPFAVGQTITGSGIPFGTTITAVKGGELKISKAATANTSGAALEAFSACTEVAKACTLNVSAAAEAQSGKSGSFFWTASADGSKTIFLNGEDLYEATIEEDVEGNLSVQTGLIAHQVVAKLGVSEDAQRIYFASGAVLTTGSNVEGRSPVNGQPNLYLYDAGKSGAERFAFIGALTSAEPPKILRTGASNRLARVTPDGNHAAFVSFARLTGYDNRDIASGEPDTEVFIYDATANEGKGRLSCVSCNPSGARPRGQLKELADLGPPQWQAGEIPPAWTQLYASRPLSENGARLFFNSFDALSHRDTNGREDVYEWEAPGEGGCSEEDPSYRPRNGGCIYLISSGTSPEDSRFLDADSEGRNVFFTTLDSLLTQDPGLVDVYDARVGGGLPPPPTPAPQCEGEACQGTPEAPNDPTPASSNFEGAGNVHEEPPAVRPKPCAKGKVKRHGKCVAKKHKHAHKRAKRNRRAGR